MATRKASGRTGKAAKKSGGKKSEDVLVPPTRATSLGSATGQALQGDREIPQGEDRGSTAEVQDRNETPDIEGGQKPVGAQAEPAIFSSNGQIEHGTVPSASGSVPAATQEAADAHIQKIKDENAARTEARVTHKRLSAETINRLGRPELKAIAVQRGYDMPDAGHRASRAAFLKAQDADKSTED